MSIRVITLLLAGALGACSGDGATVTDDARAALGDQGADLPAAPDDRTAPGDAPAVDVPPADAPGVDATALDAPTVDRPGVDAPDASTVDVAVAAEAGARDAASLDATATPDRPAATDAGPAVDARADVGVDAPRDVPAADAGCAGPGPTVTVTAPASAEMIETCSATGAPVEFDFVAAVVSTVGVRSVRARWITPDGAEAPPPAELLAPPYRFRRLVGGPSAAVPALSVFGIRGVWRVEFTAVDACGRAGVATQSFTLIFTTRRCPNP